MVWENVPGAFSSNSGEDFRVVLEEAARVSEPSAAIPGPPKGKWAPSGSILGDGWSIAWRVLDAQFWGVPQRRKRIALVADFGGHAAPEVLFERESVSGDIEPGRAEGEGPADGAERGADETGRNCLTPWDAQSARVYSADGTWHSLDANENGGQSRDAVFCPDVAHALRAKSNLNFREDGDTLICASFIGGQGAKAGGIGWAEELAPTLKAAESGSNRAPCVLSFAENQKGEVRTAEVCGSLSTGGGKPGQGYPCICIQGNTIDRNAQQHGAGLLPDISYTLDAVDRHAVFDARGNGNGELVPTPTGDHQNRVTDYTALMLTRTYQDICGTLSPGSHAGGFNGQDAYNDMLPCDGKAVRRLTPLECERLQGYPDGWTDIGPWTDSKGKLHKESSDSARYKALGNSIALPQWRWVMLRISALYERPATLGSLFDGIGGFPLVWERLNGLGSCLWASEIEEFPIAVTRYHFGGGLHHAKV